MRSTGLRHPPARASNEFHSTGRGAARGEGEEGRRGGGRSARWPGHVSRPASGLSAQWPDGGPGEWRGSAEVRRLGEVDEVGQRAGGRIAPGQGGKVPLLLDGGQDRRVIVDSR